MRVEATIAGLSEVADVLVMLVDVSEHAGRVPVDRRVDIVIPSRRARPTDRLLRFVHVLPTDVHYARRRAVRREIRAALADQSWDLVWCSRARIDLLTRGVVDGPRVVDLDDLNDQLLRSTVRQRRALRGTLRTLPRNMWDWLDALRWTRLQRTISARVERVVVCRSADAAHLGVHNAEVVPNGYPAPQRTRRLHRLEDRPPTMVFAGALTYEPNLLGVEWFVQEVLPLVRAEVPDAELTVLGIIGEDADGLRTDGVQLAGRVADVTPYYERARLAVAPIQCGGGTRLKVIEALARRVPLVSTAFGCAGFGLRHGDEVLIADDPAKFAAACIALLRDPSRAEQLAASGRERFERDLSAQACERAIAALARSVLTTAAGPSPERTPAEPTGARASAG